MLRSFLSNKFLFWDLCPLVYCPGKDEQEARQPVNVREHVRVNRLYLRESNDPPLSPPAHCSSHMKLRPGNTASRRMNLRNCGRPEFSSSVTPSILTSCSFVIRGTFAVTSSLAKSPPRIHRSLWMSFRICSNFFTLICALASPS